MARKDYVKGGRAPKKRSKKSAPAKKPWKAIILALILVLGLAYLLFSLSQDPEPPKQEISTPISKAPSQDDEVLPPPPKEEWDYVKTLPEREVKVVPKKEKLSAIPYVMQCGAYKSRAQAEERKMDIAFQGLSSEIRQRKGSSWYRVTLGPYARKRQAEKEKHKLQRAKIEPCLIWKDTGQ
ncbi:SPOR domain-containing protein [Vibrio gallicus]|uniref:SPOR domain-containing protein n=1 Tax=Vibrio gallicus TaxID=190897 RepID=UPI0021C37A7A|nr:SPOR domain-containing protein [Vibrio gallicus]